MVGIYLDTNKDDANVVQLALLGLDYKWKGGGKIPIDLPDNATIIINTVAKSKFLEWNTASPEDNLLNNVYALSKVSVDGVVNSVGVAITPPAPPPEKFDKLPLAEFEYFDTDWTLIRIRVDNINNNFYFGYNVLTPETKKEKFERARMRNINFLEFGGQVIEDDDEDVIIGGGQGGGKKDKK